MGKKVVKTVRYTETDKHGRTVDVEETKTCGPVCSTVKTVGKVAAVGGLIALLVKASR